ncbi:MAG: type II secretion system secretin GspD [Deltaproteobacteria bacterium]|nr:type II secretion system secretin GspD [Deltaproteobacteria bacterium]
MTRTVLRIVAAIVVVGTTALARAETPAPTPGAPAPNGGPSAAPEAAKTSPAPDDSVVLNFEGADIREVIHSLADSLGINYQIDPRIQGQVTIRTTGPIAKEDLFPIFNRILRSNGISAVQVGDIYQIIPVAEAKTKAIIPVAPGEKRQASREDAFIIEVVKVEHVAAQEMVNVLQPFVTPGGDVIPYARANLLIVTDLESNVIRLKDLVATFDRDAFRDLRAKVYKIEHANIEEIGQELIAILDTYGVTPASAEERGVYIIPLQRLNSLVIVAFNPTIFAEVDRWMKLLDVPPEEGAGRSVHVYAVENAKAADLAEILSELYGEGSSSRQSQQQGFTPFGTRQRGGIGGAQAAGRHGGPVVGRQNNPAPVVGAPAAPRVNQMLDGFDDYAPLQQFDDSSGIGSSSSSSSRRGRSGGIGGSSSRGGFGNTNNSSSGFGNSQGAQGFVLAGGEPGDIFRQEVRIVADDVTNSLVVLATKKDYADIREVLRRLDVVPRQVLIEVLVAEVTLGDDMKFGVEWAMADQSRARSAGGARAIDRITGSPTNTNADSDNANNNASLFDLNALGSRAADVVPLPGTGMFGIISDNRNFALVMNAAAGKNKLKVLSAPHIMTADNHEAHILVGNEVPIVTTQSNATTTQTNGTSNILQNIQYRDTGVILTVLPQVNSEGLVNMQIRQEVSQVASATTGGIQSPTFSTRESETTVVVQSGETIVIGGIIDDTVDRARTGVPFLMDIPVVGRAFRIESDTVRRTELIVLLTPHVVRDRQESRNATEAFKSRLKGMERDLYRYERSRPDYGSGQPSDETLDEMRVSPPAP